MKLTLVKTLNGTFKLAYNSDYELAKKIPLNEPIEFEYKRHRNLKFHRKYFALINLVFDNQEHFKHIDDLRAELTIEAGYFDYYFTLQGEERKKAKSISFSAMGEDEFNLLYNTTVDTICKYFHFDKQSLVDEVSQYF